MKLKFTCPICFEMFFRKLDWHLHMLDVHKS